MADTPDKRGGRRKDGKPYKEGNMRDDGGYRVGRNRAPVGTQFAVGDNRTRGNRKKGVPNADTEFLEELNRKVPLRENGKERKVTKSRAVDIRLIENAIVKGQNPAIALVDERRRRIREKSDRTALYSHDDDHKILEDWFAQQLALRGVDPGTYGDPIPSEHDQDGEDAPSQASDDH